MGVSIGNILTSMNGLFLFKTSAWESPFSAEYFYCIKNSRAGYSCQGYSLTNKFVDKIKIPVLELEKMGCLAHLRSAESCYTAPKTVALYGARVTLPVKTRLWPRHRLEEVPSLSSFHCPAGRETVRVVSVGL